MLAAPWPVGAWTRDSVDVDVDARMCAGERSSVAFGGWLMAMVVEAAVQEGRDVTALTCRFLKRVEKGETLRVDVSQESGRTIAHVDLSLVSAVGVAVEARVVAMGRDGQSETWLPMPETPDPRDCPERTYRPGATDLRSLLDVRLASPEASPERRSGGDALLWARVGGGASAAAKLAVLADHVPYFVARSSADVLHAITVEASLRFLAPPISDWILLRLSMSGADQGRAVGGVEMWDQSGRAVLTSEQTVRVLRARPELRLEPPPS